MIYTRIRSYYPSGEFTGCEHLFHSSNHAEALAWFRKEYPEHKDCIVIAETYDSESNKNAEHFKACLRCGCVH